MSVFVALIAALFCYGVGLALALAYGGLTDQGDDPSFLTQFRVAAAIGSILALAAPILEAM